MTIIPENSVLIATAGQGKTRGTVAVNEIEICTNDAMLSMIPSENTCYIFLLYALEYRYQQLRLLTPQNTKTRLTTKLLGNFQIRIPVKDEQTEIGKLIRNFDSKIELQESKLTKLIEVKKGYMQRLFA